MWQIVKHPCFWAALAAAVSSYWNPWMLGCVLLFLAAYAFDKLNEAKKSKYDLDLVAETAQANFDALVQKIAILEKETIELKTRTALSGGRRV